MEEQEPKPKATREPCSRPLRGTKTIHPVFWGEPVTIQVPGCNGRKSLPYKGFGYRLCSECRAELEDMIRVSWQKYTVPSI